MRYLAYLSAAAMAVNAISWPSAAEDASVDDIFVGEPLAPLEPSHKLEARAARRQGIPAGPVATTYQQAVLQHHNYHRANHSAKPLKWSPRMASIARAIAQKCVYQHDVQTGGGGYGQNIAAGAPFKDISNVITDQFYNNEVNLYPGYGDDNPDMTNFHEWGHFSQIVWTDTTEVGCFTYDCSKKKGGLGKITGVYGNIAPLFTVCNYYPPGNYMGEFTKVKKSINRVTVNGDFRVNKTKIRQINPPPLSFYTKNNN